MVDPTLPVPGLLLELVDRGVWPADWQQAARLEEAYPPHHFDGKQRTEWLERYGPPLVSVERIRLIHPKESCLHFEPPPFLPSRQRSHTAWGQEEFFASAEVDRDLIIEIGDFGHGSDTPIILDYENRPEEPNVRRLAIKLVRSGPEGRRRSWDNHWVEIAPSFDEFARLLGLV